MAAPHLPARPRAETWSIEDLVARIRAGGIRIPAFQRPLRWRAKDVENLMDSIWHGYPVGNLLFWRRAGPAGRIHIGNSIFDVDERSDAYFVVDGQQRLISLASVLLHPRPTRSSRDIFALWFDLEEERFVGPTQARPRKELLPLNKALDAVDLQTWWAEQHHLQERHDLFRTALMVGKRIREYQIPAYIVETDEEEMLRIIFTRLNTAGVGMKLHEVFRALHLEDDGDDPLNSVAHVFVETGMGTWNRDALLQCLRSASGDDLSTPMSQEYAAYRPNVDRSCGAISLALEFLRDELHIPHIKLLPGRFPLIALIRLFSLHPEIPERVNTLLRRWFWRGIVSGRHIDMNNARLHWLYESLTGDLDITISAMLADSGCPTVDTVNSFSQSLLKRTRLSAHAVKVKVGLTILADRGPRDVATSELIDIAGLIEVAGTTAYGRVERPGHWRVIHPRIDQLAAVLDSADVEVQKSHLWVRRDRNGEARKALLRDAFADRLIAWCEPTASDHLPIFAALAELGEE